MTIVRLAVIPVWNPGKRMVSSQCPDTGMALLHSNRKNLVATDKIHYK
ncbi:hypothetical protein ACJZL1_03860 [Wolbachia endosymbiont of Rhagoletis indifferens]